MTIMTHLGYQATPHWKKFSTDKGACARSIYFHSWEQKCPPKINACNTLWSSETELQSHPSVPTEKLSKENWANMSKTQSRSYLRKQKETRGETTRTLKESTKAKGSMKRPKDSADFTLFVLTPE